jgi:hypothetical protein
MVQSVSKRKDISASTFSTIALSPGSRHLALDPGLSCAAFGVTPSARGCAATVA